MGSCKKNILKVLFFFIFYPANSQDLKNVDYWEELFKNEIEKNKQINSKLIEAKDSWNIYKLAGSLDSYISMYRATSDTEYLDLGIDLVKSVINSAKLSKFYKSSQYKDSYLGWINKSHEEKGNDGKEYPLYESYFWRYVTVLIRELKNPKVYMEYHEVYNELLVFTEKHIFDKWYSRGYKNIHRENTNMSSHWATISFNLWKVSGKKKYLKVCEDFNHKFINQLQKNKDGTLFWNSFWDRKRHTKYGQDISHGNGEVSYIVECFDYDYFFDSNVINSLILTFKRNILREDLLSSSLYIDGSGNGKGRFIDGFMKLGRYDKEVQFRLENFQFKNESVFHRRIQFLGNMALNVKLMQ